MSLWHAPSIFLKGCIRVVQGRKTYAVQKVSDGAPTMDTKGLTLCLKRGQKYICTNKTNVKICKW